MSHNDAVTQLDRLVSSSPAAVHSWLTAIDAGDVSIPEGFNWLGLAQAAAHRARTDLNLEWAGVAAALYTRIARDNVDWQGDSASLDLMNLRAFFIKRMGPRPGDPVLALHDLVTWFLSNLPISLEQAQCKSAHREHLPIEEMRALRGIKNRLAVFEELTQLDWLNPYPAIKEWLALRNQLP